VGQLGQRLPRDLQRRNLPIERRDPLASHFAGAGAIVAAVELDQLGDLGQREPGSLRLLDVAQAPQVLLIVMSPAGRLSPRTGEQARALIEANRFDADAPRPRQVGNAHRFHA
jgi:hypothetical protein